MDEMKSTLAEQDMKRKAEHDARVNRATVENLRRFAARYGVGLVKSRRRNPNAPGYGRYYLFNSSTNGFDLDGVRNFLLAAIASFERKKHEEA